MRLTELPAPTATPPVLPAYATREQQLARRHNTVAPYLRLDDGRCRSFLDAALYPPEFEGVKLLFPFVREAALLQVPRDRKHLTDWMYFAFHAGNDLGARHPELLQEVLPDYELRDARRRMGVIKLLAEQEVGTGRALHRAFGRILEKQWPDNPAEKLDALYAELAMRTLRTGFAVATLAQLDPQLCDFYGTTVPNARLNFPHILWRHWLGAPADSVGRTIVDLLEHPLLRVVSQLYPGRATECAVVQDFLREHLAECGAVSENDCPASDAELIDWVAAGIDYGRRIQREQPETVQRIFAECNPKAFEDGLDQVRTVVAQAGGSDPAHLLPLLKRWQKSVYDGDEPYFYGQSVERVALFADFAIWIPWTASQPAARSHDLASPPPNPIGNDDHEQSLST